MKDKIRELLAEIWPFILVLALLCLAVNWSQAAETCWKKKPAKVVHDTCYVNKVVFQDRYVHDSTYVHDSVFVMVKGDTVYIEKDHIVYKNKYVHDTSFVHDTSYVVKDVPVEVVKVEKKISWFWTIFMSAAVLILIWLTKNGIWVSIWNWIKRILHLTN